MNKTRRKALETVANTLDELRTGLESQKENINGNISSEPSHDEVLKTASGKVSDAESEVETQRDEEQEYYDNMPESLQGGDKGSAAEEAVGYLDDAISELQDVVTNLDEAASSYKTFKEAKTDDSAMSCDDCVNELDNAITALETAADRIRDAVGV